MHSSPSWICVGCALAERSHSVPQCAHDCPYRLRPRQKPPRRRAPAPAPALAPDLRLFVSCIHTSFPAGRSHRESDVSKNTPPQACEI
eukprot:3732041-Pleurochrysis_carterae.AAC.1